MRQKQAQRSMKELFETKLNSKIKRSPKTNRIWGAEIRSVAPSVTKMEAPRRIRYQITEPREQCREWFLWLLQCGLIDRSHGPVSQSGLYTDFT